MNKYEILNAIHKENVEVEILKYLQDWMAQERERLIDTNKEYRARLVTIGKMNDANKYDEFIDALCDLSDVK